jgi:hypothetical protein
MGLIATTIPAAGGSVLTLAAATAGAEADWYRNTGKEMLVVNNASGGAVTVTFVAKTTCNQGTLHDIVVSVAAGATEYLPVVNPAIYAVDSLTYVTFSAVTSVTRGVISPG